MAQCPDAAIGARRKRAKPRSPCHLRTVSIPPAIEPSVAVARSRTGFGAPSLQLRVRWMGCASGAARARGRALRAWASPRSRRRPALRAARSLAPSLHGRASQMVERRAHSVARRRALRAWASPRSRRRPALRPARSLAPSLHGRASQMVERRAHSVARRRALRAWASPRRAHSYSDGSSLRASSSSITGMPSRIGIREPRRLRDQLLLLPIVGERTLGDRADEDFKQLGIHGASPGHARRAPDQPRPRSAGTSIARRQIPCILPHPSPS